MYHVRITKTASNARAVQVVHYDNRKLLIAAHIGSAHSDKDLIELKKTAQKWIEKVSRQRPLFSGTNRKTPGLIPFDKCRYLGIRYHFSYEILTKVFARFGFHNIGNDILRDLALIRIIEPASKLRSLELIEQYFGIRHKRTEFYRSLPEFVAQKEKTETKVLAMAKRELGFDFTMVFYDVTTLYFESFEPDELRKPGFSKDNKAAQPQIVIGLIVNTNGFPVSYEVFPGNKFEGHTLIPVITAFKKKHGIESLTVVADAAMISADNIRDLKANNLSYIVGARMGNLSKTTIAGISKTLNRKDGESLRTTTKNGTLVCSFSIKRYRKDKREMEKQLAKAESLLHNPSSMKRTKFIKNKSNKNFELNKSLIEKTEHLLGVKGYYNNLGKEIPDRTIISQYHNLWHVEQAFRIAKSDLETRPIYHRKEETIKAHLLICFMALAVCKYMEIKTGQSVKRIIRSLQSVTDARIMNLLAENEFTMRSEINNETRELLEKLNLPY